MSGGIDQSGIGLMIESSNDRDRPPPELQPMLIEMKSGQPVMRRRCDWFDAETYRATAFFEAYRKPLGLDESLHAAVPVSESTVSQIVFFRAEGSPEFTDEHRAFAHQVHRSTVPLHAAGPKDLPFHEMTPRMRTVCALLIQANKRKQIAERLGITEHTARDYIRGVYRYFGVKDHVSLMHRFMIGDECPSTRMD